MWIDRPGVNVAFEVDGIDPIHRQGWSVLVRGNLDHVDPDAPLIREHFDSEPWLLADRDAWLIIEPLVVTGGGSIRERASGHSTCAYL